ncbi:MAG: hypothetical protein ACD_80C00056G0007 [uncultured bacterium (gcode 4)]|uniref:YprB ribonuclease H-like domain-containing protein n=1 Tax=uncultured bacterium (gcode 4) TaxID=1234023 RepID=K1X5G4_9BACT|nr:MAG: hypothetical protein ACD_80C00056G0007 [uncultured bacterium (gcode 4)]HBB03940.1 hypothetical protein [Candidatus Gracilibacteria bacterium]
MQKYITPSKLYAYLQCEHRVWRDVYGPQDEKIKETNPFVEMLWEKGIQHEEKVIAKLGELLDLSSDDKNDQLTKTIEAMKASTPLIYHGYLRSKNLAGEPDLLRLQSDGTYIPIDIKSGRGLEGENEDDDVPGKPKTHYAVQLALYVEILTDLGFSREHTGIIYDIDSQETIYTLDSSMGPRTPSSWWQFYLKTKNAVAKLLANEVQNDPALGSPCKLCPWYDSCKHWSIENHDLSTLFYLGRGKRTVLINDLGIHRVEDLKNVDIEYEMAKKAKDKTYLYKIGKPTLSTLQKRAVIMADTKKPVIYTPLEFPKVQYELYFDIEDDPTQNFVYLHGVYERTPKGERFIPFVAKEKTPEAEESAWKEFINYIRALPKDDWCLYYYSHHEVTTYKRMQKMYPDVISVEELEAMFTTSHAIDLYSHCILKYTDWPLYSYSLKDIAKFLGFAWRDKTPSGALSIQWFNEYLKDSDPAKLKRIVEYNEDDCKATMVIKDYLANPSL